MSVRSGTRLDGRYKLSDRIAVGGMGEVWRGTDEVLGRSVAVKILRAELAEDDAFRRRFRAEARTAGGLPHNGIAAVFDYGETTVGPDGLSPSNAPVQGDGIAYLVMELVPGEALSTILSRDGALGTDRTLSIVAQAARALHAAHTRGVVHRDVKPANLMVTPDGRVKVTDFGIARPRDHEPLTMTGQVMGTAHYLAPELARGLDASPLSDVYALGVVAYECLAGHRPFDGDNQVLVATAHLSQQPPPLPGTIAPDVVRVVGAAMEKDPKERIPSAEAFAIALEKLLAHDPSALDGITGGGGGSSLGAAQAPAPVPDIPPPPPTRVTSAPAGAAGAAAAAALAAAGQGGYSNPPVLGPRTATLGTAAVQEPWRPSDTAPQGTLLGPDPGFPMRRDAGGNRTGGPGSRALLDDGPPARRFPVPLIIGLAVLGLVVVAVLVFALSRGGDSPGPFTPSPSTKTTGPAPTGTVTGGPTTTGTATGTHTSSHSATPSKTKTATATATGSATGSPSSTTSPRPTTSPTAPSPTPDASVSVSATETPVASGSSTASGAATAAAGVGLDGVPAAVAGVLNGAAGGRTAP